MPLITLGKEDFELTVEAIRSRATYLRCLAAEWEAKDSDVARATVARWRTEAAKYSRLRLVLEAEQLLAG